MRLALLLVFVAGCAVERDFGPVAPLLEPPPLRAGEPLTRDQALAIAREDDADRAIARLDDRRFAFVLDPSTLVWFEKNGASPEVVDYLRKRTRVDWENLRGDVDPASPEQEYIDPRRGFDDWAGFGRRESFSGSPRSRDPFAR